MPVNESKVASKVLEFLSNLASGAISNFFGSISGTAQSIGGWIKSLKDLLKDVEFNSPTLNPIIGQASDLFANINQNVVALQQKGEATVVAGVNQIGMQAAASLGIKLENNGTQLADANPGTPAAPVTTPDSTAQAAARTREIRS